MSNFNQITLMGRVGRDPEIKSLPEGKKLARFSMAVSEKVTRQGERVEETEWFNATGFDKVADVLEKFVHKGDLIFIQGKFKSRKWKADDGTERTYNEVVIHQMQLMSPRREEKPAEAETPGPADDLPF